MKSAEMEFIVRRTFSRCKQINLNVYNNGIIYADLIKCIKQTRRAAEQFSPLRNRFYRGRNLIKIESF
jgi:hypothetical protein